MSDSTEEARQVIDRLRQQRAAVGDTSRIKVKPIHYKRVSRSKAAQGLTFFYTFLAGMLFSEFLKGSTAALLAFLFIAFALCYTILKE